MRETCEICGEPLKNKRFIRTKFCVRRECSAQRGALGKMTEGEEVAFNYLRQSKEWSKIVGTLNKLRQKAQADGRIDFILESTFDMTPLPVPPTKHRRKNSGECQIVAE